MHDHILYTLETLGCYFPTDVICAVDVGIEKTPVCSTKQTTLDTLACIQLMFTEIFMVKKALP
ncbi:hypothetical protein KSB_05050 [Ktedonobacter robiniae]|uniref:Uncharacterized protein n=1 Tax=Ktedonobacter robiniae TaxID=2778365 RepID=A0ABQ3UHY4_9CHLR|nr:hypothetical protein KSB_05050 [Ktedonobacter robiniae]